VTIPAFVRNTLTSRPHIAALEPAPPAWVRDLLIDEPGTSARIPESNGRLQVVRKDPFVRLTAHVANATALAGEELSDEVSEGYAAIAAWLQDAERHPIRFWNYVPGIVEPLDGGIDRYMAFNRGRHAVYSAHASLASERSVPCASAVGINGPDLVIDCLASTCGGRPVENPRQRATWRYSRRYGPKPPYFARGTITSLDGRRVLLLAGTASIVGEESRHAGDAPAQTAEIIRNIEALLVNAGASRRRPLEQLTDLRIYVVRPGDAGLVEAEIRARTRPAVRIETVLARVCRPELLVEIEGVADLPADDPERTTPEFRDAAPEPPPA
jgi:chorismate lyase/3-hydroxybenzoate synthase